MAISDAKLEEFITIYERLYGRRLSIEDARPAATRLVMLYRLVMRPLPPTPQPPIQTQSEAG